MNSKAITIGITGGIGSGKSFIAEVFEKMNFPVFYSDKQAKDLINSSAIVRKSIIDLLGEDAYQDGVYNAVFVAGRVFNDSDLRLKLNEIVHPAVNEVFRLWVNEKSQYSDIVFNEAAIMIETGSYRQMDKVILVSAPIDMRVERVMSRDGLDKDAVLKRLNSQSTDEFKRQFSQYEIINDGRAILPQVLDIIDLIRP